MAACLLLNKCQSTRAAKSKQLLLNALQRFNTKCLPSRRWGEWAEGAAPESSTPGGVHFGRGTYTVLMLFMASNVPLASDWMLLSYSESRLRLCRSRKASLRMQEISLAFSSSSCSELSPLNTPEGKSFILLPYNTLQAKKKENERKTHEQQQQNEHKA